MATANNLPAQLSSFVGRETQLAELRRLIRRSRLITLTGPGGAGKTRLALRLAQDVLERNPGGVWLVELASIGDAGLVEQTVAATCGAREERHRSINEAIVERLGAGKTLLILDSCEHLVDACAALAGTLLRSCPGMTLIVTSREPLGVEGELTWRTPSLSLPQPKDAGRPELILQSEAVRLFVERAKLSRPGFALDGTVSEAVAQICARLEGMPLAIELAAGLERVMTPQEILARLRDSFRLLTGGSKTSRHQTLRQAVEWSYGLLSPDEKDLLARLAIFAGGFDLAAAEAAGARRPADRETVLPILSRLVDKSLVAAEQGASNQTRYRILETIREYALERLPPDKRRKVRGLHAKYFTRWCIGASAGLFSGEQESLLRVLDEEQPNIRLALDWSLAEQPEDAARLAAAMGVYWLMRYRAAEGVDWCNRALAVEGAGAEARAFALLARARLNWRHGDYTLAEQDAELCDEMCRRLGMDHELTGTLTMLGLLSSGRENWDGAVRYHREALEIARRIREPVRVAVSLNNLALVDSALGNHQSAISKLEEALEIDRGTGDRYNTALTLDSLGRVCLKLGDRAGARRNYLRALAISTEFDSIGNTATCLEGLAMLALAEGDPARAVKLMGSAGGLRKDGGDPAAPDWGKEVEAGMASARAKLGRQAAEAAWRQGAALGFAGAMRFATGAAAHPADAGVPAAGGESPLSARELQVAKLVASGMTNGDIAQQLRVSERTADAHLEHIRNKLGLRSRAQIAVWAHERLGTSLPARES